MADRRTCSECGRKLDGIMAVHEHQVIPWERVLWIVGLIVVFVACYLAFQ